MCKESVERDETQTGQDKYCELDLATTKSDSETDEQDGKTSLLRLSTGKGSSLPDGRRVDSLLARSASAGYGPLPWLRSGHSGREFVLQSDPFRTCSAVKEIAPSGSPASSAARSRSAKSELSALLRRCKRPPSCKSASEKSRAVLRSALGRRPYVKRAKIFFSRHFILYARTYKTISRRGRRSEKSRTAYGCGKSR
jgi:hypothetical protein